jgi:hypothetical protein
MGPRRPRSWPPTPGRAAAPRGDGQAPCATGPLHPGLARRRSVRASPTRCRSGVCGPSAGTRTRCDGRRARESLLASSSRPRAGYNNPAPRTRRGQRPARNTPRPRSHGGSAAPCTLAGRISGAPGGGAGVRGGDAGPSATGRAAGGGARGPDQAALCTLAFRARREPYPAAQPEPPRSRVGTLNHYLEGNCFDDGGEALPPYVAQAATSSLQQCDSPTLTLRR